MLKLWSHVALDHDSVLCETPDYLIAKQSELGDAVLGKPILVAIEAKQDDFELGWGQCSAEMVSVQKINADEEMTVFGIATNGESWEFGKLEGKCFTYPYTIGDLEKLFGVLSYIMEECAKQVTQVQRSNSKGYAGITRNRSRQPQTERGGKTRTGYRRSSIGAVCNAL